MKLLHEAHCERIVGGGPVGNITVSPTTEVKPKVVTKTTVIGQFSTSTQNIANAGVNTALTAAQYSVQTNTLPA